MGKEGETMLTFNLKKEWFEKIKSGETTHEYREVKPYWTKRLSNEFLLPEFERLNVYHPICNHIVRFVKGYSNKADNCVSGIILQVRKRNGKHTDLAIDKDVYDIEFELLED